MAKRPDRRRAWPVRAWRALTRPFIAALVSGIADPPPPRAGWRTPEAFQHLRQYLPSLAISRIDVVVIGEILTALAVFAGTNSTLISANEQAGSPIGDGELLMFASAAAAAPLLLRDLWPLAAWRVAVPSMIFVWNVTSVIHGHDGSASTNPYPIGALVAYLLVLYSVGVRCARHISVGVWVLTVLGMLITAPGPVVLFGTVTTAASLLFGYNVRVRRQAQRQVVEEERRTEDERAARAVLEERSRIARELHDVVAHHMSVIAIQAEAAPIKAPSDPEVLKAELAGIRGTALEALTELRRVLGVLREGDQAPETAPQPDLAGIDQLLASFRAAGLAVTMTTAGRPPPVPGGIGLATYRVLQESLSNALRHAPGAPVEIQLTYHGDRLELRVENGRPRQHPAPAARTRGGQGLTGMRERVGAYGGTLTTGPTAAGGFAVAATIPYHAAALVERP